MAMNHTMRTPQRIRTVLGLLTATALLALAGCGGSGDSADPSDDASSSASSSDTASPDAAASDDPDLEGIPDVLAEVNGEEVTIDEFAPIYKSQLEQATSQAQTSGQEPDLDALKKQTVDDLVDTELLSQEADSRGIEVSDEEIDGELTTLAQQNQLASADELLAAVAERGVTEDQAREQVRIQLMVEKLVEDEDGPVEPTDKELRQLYAVVKQQAASQGSEQQIPPFKDARAQLVEQATSQTIGQVAGSLVKDLRKDADITVNL